MNTLEAVENYAALSGEKYRPNTPDGIHTSIILDINDELTKRLKHMAGDGEIPHLMFYGPSGAGKKTRILALLKAIYGKGVERVRLEHQTFKTPSNKSIELTTVASNYHIEMSPGDAGIYDRIIVQDVIKEIASSQSLTASWGSGISSENGNPTAFKPTFKVVLLTGVDRLTRQAQSALRRTMEKVLEPVKSRCLGIRVPAPSEADICRVLQAVCRKEQEALSDELATKIAHASGRNLRQALLILEASVAQGLGGGRTQPENVVAIPDWESHIANIAEKVVQKQHPATLANVRTMLYELLTNCIPSDVIMQVLLKYLLKKGDEGVQHELTHWAAFYEHRLHIGSKDIFHLEAFVAKAMSIFHQFALDIFGDF